MSLQVIPLTNAPNQTLNVNLTVDGAALSLTLILRYSAMCGYWLMSIYTVTGVLLVDSIPLITGAWPAANLLEQQRYLGIGSWYIVNASNTTPQVVSQGYGSVGYGEGPYGGGGYGGGALNSVAVEQTDYPDNNDLGSAYQLWVGDTPSI